MIYAFIFSSLLMICTFCSYLVKDYRNGIIYTGIVGKIQNLIKH